MGYFSSKLPLASYSVFWHLGLFLLHPWKLSQYILSKLKLITKVLSLHDFFLSFKKSQTKKPNEICSSFLTKVSVASALMSHQTFQLIVYQLDLSLPTLFYTWSISDLCWEVEPFLLNLCHSPAGHLNTSDFIKSNCFNACTSAGVLVNMLVIQAVHHTISFFFF